MRFKIIRTLQNCPNSIPPRFRPDYSSNVSDNQSENQLRSATSPYEIPFFVGSGAACQSELPYSPFAAAPPPLTL